MFICSTCRTNNFWGFLEKQLCFAHRTFLLVVRVFKWNGHIYINYIIQLKHKYVNCLQIVGIWKEKGECYFFWIRFVLCCFMNIEGANFPAFISYHKNGVFSTAFFEYCGECFWWISVQYYHSGSAISRNILCYTSNHRYSLEACCAWRRILSWTTSFTVGLVFFK